MWVDESLVQGMYQSQFTGIFRNGISIEDTVPFFIAQYFLCMAGGYLSLDFKGEYGMMDMK